MIIDESNEQQDEARIGLVAFAGCQAFVEIDKALVERIRIAEAA